MIKKILFLFILINFTYASEETKLFLKWKHQFQFAGYYMAKEKGYYKKAGFNVDIVEKEFGKDEVDRVLNTKNSYGIFNSGLIKQKLQGKPVVALAAIFQESPLIFLARKDSGITKLNHFKNKKVAFNENRDIALVTALKSVGMSQKRYFKREFLFDYSTLINKKDDVVPAYITDQPYEYKMKGLETNIIDPVAYGINFYGDMLFTSYENSFNNPDRVRAFKEASIKGWKYAIDNIDETIQVIKERYRSKKSVSALKYEAIQTIKLIKADRVPIGQITPKKIKDMVNAFIDLNYDATGFSFENFVFEGKDKKHLINNILSNEEKLWLSKNPVIRVANDIEYHPIDFFNGKKADGYSIDVIRLIANKLDLNIKFVPNQWEKLVADFKDNKIDILTSISPSSEFDDFSIYSKPYAFIPDVFIVRKDEKNIKTPKELENKKVAVPVDYEYIDLFKKENITIDPLEVSNTLSSLKSVSKGEADATVCVLPVAKYHMEKYNINNLKIVNKIFIDKKKKEGDTYFAINKDKKILASIINKGLDLISENEKYYLEKKWHVTPNLKRIELNAITSEDIKLLDSIGFLKIGVDGKWAPFELFENGIYKGLIADYYEYFNDALDIEFNYVTKDPWKNLLDDMKKGKVDLLSAVVKTNAREDYMFFTDPIVSFSIMIVGREKESFIEDISILENKRVGVVDGYYTHDLLREKYPKVIPVTFKDTKEGLKSLSAQKIDYFIGAIPVVNNIITTEGIDNLKLVGTMEEKFELCIGVNKNYPDLVHLLNKIIKSIPQEFITKVHNRWIGIKIENKTDYTYIWKILAVISVILTAIIIWNRKLMLEVNKRKKAEAEAKKLQKLAEEANRSKSEFLSNMSHEIRTPMNAIIGFSEILSKTKLDNKQKEYIKTIMDSSRSLISIINDILDLSKIESGKMEIKYGPTNLRTITKEVEQIFKAQIVQKELDFIISIDKDLPKSLMLDEIRIRQILINLVGNAIKFTPKGEVKLVISCDDAQKEKVKLMIEVHDTGIGIAPKDQVRIFKSFTQQSQQSTRKYGGTGLGLTITKKFVDLMEGRITLRSFENKGSSFFVSFYKIEVVQNTLLEQDIKEETTGHFIFDKSNILLVDDIKTNRDVIKNYYGDSNLNFYEALNGKEGVEIAIREKPDLILMDLKMPVMDGYEATKILHNDERTRFIPIIAISASVLKDEQEKIKEHNFEAFVSKPVDFEKLDTLLSKYIHYTKEEEDNETQFIINETVLEKLIDKIQQNGNYRSFKTSVIKAKSSGALDDIKKVSNILAQLNTSESNMVSKKIDGDMEKFDIESIEQMIIHLNNTIERRKDV